MTSTSGAVAVNGVRLHVEEHGRGAPILCIHGAGSSALVWAGATERLARLGRVIAYDRRGCARSERPPSYRGTTVTEQADDAAALLAALDAAPAIVVARSYGGWIAVALALRHPERVRALVLLEPDAPGLAPAADAWVAGLSERLHAVAAAAGVDAVAEALITEAAGAEGWRRFPPEVRRLLTGNGPAILAEVRLEGPRLDPAALAALDQPALVLVAEESPPAFREAPRALAEAMPNARLAQVGGGHLIDPAAPEVLAFVEEVLRSPAPSAKKAGPVPRAGAAAPA